MKDQYGQAVPADLVVLPSYTLCTYEERAAIFRETWYEANGILLADLPMAAAGLCLDPRDVGLDVDEDGNLEGCEIRRIAAGLKRGNSIDGFYHA